MVAGGGTAELVMNFTTRVTENQACTLVAVTGELDMNTAPELHDVLAAAIDAREVNLVLDLADLRFCDSAGLAVLVGAHNRLDADGRRLVVAAPTAAVARVLDLSGVSQVIPTAEDPDEACAMLDGQRLE
jgi:anti-anti-sigma factor